MFKLKVQKTFIIHRLRPYTSWTAHNIISFQLGHESLQVFD